MKKTRCARAKRAVERGSHASSQAAELQRRWQIATLLDHQDRDDDNLIISTTNDALRRTGLPNLGNTCFINAAIASFGAPAAFFALRLGNRHACCAGCRRFAPRRALAAVQRKDAGSAAPHVAFWFRVARRGLQSVWLLTPKQTKITCAACKTAWSGLRSAQTSSPSRAVLTISAAQPTEHLAQH